MNTRRDDVGDLGIDPAIALVADHEAIVLVVDDEAFGDTLDRIVQQDLELALPHIGFVLVGGVLIRGEYARQLPGSVAHEFDLAINPADVSVGPYDTEMDRSCVLAVKGYLARTRHLIAVFRVDVRAELRRPRSNAAALEPEDVIHFVGPLDHVGLEVPHRAAGAR